MSNIGNNLYQTKDVAREVIDGNRVMVKYESKYMRGQIIKFPRRDKNSLSYRVLLVDFGIFIICTDQDFYTAIADSCEKRKSLLEQFFLIPPVCFECKLAKIQPTATQQYGWSQTAIDFFKLVTADNDIELDLYAFNHEDKIASVEVIIYSNGSSERKYMSRTLIALGLAKECGESYVTTYNRYNNEIPEHLRYEMLTEFKEIPVRQDLLEEKVNLDGPYSPLEAIPCPIYRNRESGITLESSSVLSILFDPYPNDGLQKVLVASSKSKNYKGVVTLRQLTLLPHIVGMSSFIGLLFSAYAQIRFDKQKFRCTSILTGLGCDFTGKPYYGEHDCLIRTDVDIDNEDFNNINELRREFSNLLQNSNKVTTDSRINICTLLLNILRKDRIPLSMQFNDKRDSYDWERMIDERGDEMFFQREQIFSNHRVLKMIPLSYKDVTTMKGHIQELEEKAVHSVTKDEEIECKLCCESFSIFDLQMHCESSMHKRLKSKYDKNYEKLRQLPNVPNN